MTALSPEFKIVGRTVGRADGREIGAGSGRIAGNHRRVAAVIQGRTVLLKITNFVMGNKTPLMLLIILQQQIDTMTVDQNARDLQV